MSRTNLSAWARAREARRKRSLVVPAVVLTIVIVTLLRYGLVVFVLLPAAVLLALAVSWLNFERSRRPDRAGALVSAGFVRRFAGPFLDGYKP